MTHSTKSSDDVRKRLAKLFAMLGSSNAGERENARALIDKTDDRAAAIVERALHGDSSHA